MNPALAICLAILKITLLVGGAPVEPQTSIQSTTRSPNCNNEDGDFYDQRQNGTENYRIHVNEVVVLVAPADAVLQAAQLSNQPHEPEVSGIASGSQVLKPKPRPPSPSDKIPAEDIQQPPSSDQTTGKESLKHNSMELKQKRQM